MTQVIGLGLFAKENDEETGGYILNGEGKVLGTIGRLGQPKQCVLAEIRVNMPASNLRVIADFLDKLNAAQYAADRRSDAVSEAVEREASGN